MLVSTMIKLYGHLGYTIITTDLDQYKSDNVVM